MLRKYAPPRDAADVLRELLIGQPHAIDAIVPKIEQHKARMNPQGRPAGVFLLLGPTGTGKTRTVEAVAETLHEDPKCLVRIDCAEYQSEHEISKLIGAPPSYLGHRETTPRITNAVLSHAMSTRSGLAVILFDEIEKASPALHRLLLGILDYGTLRLGDNAIVGFEDTLVFFTSNVGAQAMQNAVRPGWSPLEPYHHRDADPKRVQRSADRAARQEFPPEFLNRVDEVISYRTLTAADLARIIDLEILALQGRLDARLKECTFRIQVTDYARGLLLKKGESKEYNARYLKRTLETEIMAPIARLKTQGRILPGDEVTVLGTKDGELKIKTPSDP